MGRALREAQDVGLSRIELTFTALTKEAENQLFHPLFWKEAEVKLNTAEQALR